MWRLRRLPGWIIWDEVDGEAGGLVERVGVCRGIGGPRGYGAIDCCGGGGGIIGRTEESRVLSA